MGAGVRKRREERAPKWGPGKGSGGPGSGMLQRAGGSAGGTAPPAPPRYTDLRLPLHRGKVMGGRNAC